MTRIFFHCATGLAEASPGGGRGARALPTSSNLPPHWEWENDAKKIQKARLEVSL